MSRQLAKTREELLEKFSGYLAPSCADDDCEAEITVAELHALLRLIGDQPTEPKS